MSGLLHPFRLRLSGPEVHFPTILFGHGWIFLAPNEPAEDRSGFRRTLLLSTGNRAVVQVRSSGSICGRSAVPLVLADRQEIARAVRRMLRLDEDLSGFQNLCRGHPTLGFVHRTKAGRLLRSPTVFEDVVKTLCTTNCSWANTKNMVTRLCRLAGGVFPCPSTLARLGAERLRSECRLGYRAAYVHEFSRRVASGELDPESWLTDPHGGVVYEQLRGIRGAGPYAVHHILMLLGRYDLVPVDSEVRRWIEQTHFRGRSVPLPRLLKRYAPFAPWQFLAFKFERIALRDNYIN